MIDIPRERSYIERERTYLNATNLNANLSECRTHRRNAKLYRPIPDRESAWLAATLYTAGAETTSGVLSWFMLAMILYPDVQKKVQEELDVVVGRDRLPTFADQESLPYLQATVREALRWHTVV
ncbi:cytochrome P450 [Lentinula lateritia]|uniref:Cytochrome P450 n=1 Tax=Lentinula lateritia TaxID=40482 RepID=A0ABQ8VMC8_9AGAR|nr:cytochrome P450 [Lentinula lateritia]